MANLLNREDDISKIIEVKELKFKIKAMLPKEKMMITQRRMSYQNGSPVSALSEDDFYYFESIAINDICIEEMPKGFKSNESCINWEDEELIFLVANEIRKHTASIQEGLKKNRPIGGIEEG